VSPRTWATRADRVVAALSLSESAVGLTLLALATTAELFALAWAASRRGVSEIAVGAPGGRRMTRT
jgi:cation:H+ antiporter